MKNSARSKMLRLTRRNRRFDFLVLTAAALVALPYAEAFQVSRKTMKMVAFGVRGGKPIRNTSGSSSREKPLIVRKYRDHDDVDEALMKTTRRATGLKKLQGATKRTVNASMIESICGNHIAAFAVVTMIVGLVQFVATGSFSMSAIHWNDNLQAVQQQQASTDMIASSLLQCVEGFLTAVPAVALATLVQKSDRRDATHVSFSTTNLALTLFGRRPTNAASWEDLPSNFVEVVRYAAWMAGIAAITEEIIFRLYIPTAIFQCTHHSVALAMIGQTLLFGLGHIHETSHSDGEKRMLCTMHMANALWFGLVYQWTGGDIIPCILGHALYDSHVLVQAWKQINDQMEWTEEHQEPHPGRMEGESLKEIKKLCGLNGETLAFCKRFFYGFDYEHRGTLSLADTQRAVSYAFIQDSEVPEQERVSEVFHAVLKRRKSRASTGLEPHEEDRIGVSEFLRILFALKSKDMATQLI